MNIIEILRRLFFQQPPQKPKWEVRRTIWPYEDGWGTYCPETHTILDTGLTKEEAERRCAELNK